MVIIEARSPENKLIEIAEVSLTEQGRVMITDNQGHQVFLSRELWNKIDEAVRSLPIRSHPEVGRH